MCLLSVMVRPLVSPYHLLTLLTLLLLTPPHNPTPPSSFPAMPRFDDELSLQHFHGVHWNYHEHEKHGAWMCMANFADGNTPPQAWNCTKVAWILS